MENLELIIVAMAVAGAVAGFLAGLLGIGGGIIMVPALYIAFAVIGAPEAWHMHLTVATSLGIIIPTAYFSARAHRKKGAVMADIVRPWTPFLIAGAVFGAVLAGYLKSAHLVLFFAIIALLMGIKMILPLEDKVLSRKPPKKPLSVLLATFIGTASSLMGIGGALMWPAILGMTFAALPKERAGLAGGLVLGIAGLGNALGPLIGGVLTDYSLGFVNLAGVLIVAPLSSLFAPLGAAAAHRLPRRVLSVIFGLFLVIAAWRMAFPLLSA